MIKLQQGDVLLRNKKALQKTLHQKTEPKGKLTLVESGIIAEGEVTGHRHRVENGTVFKDEAGDLWVKACEFSKLYHEEHGTIDLSNIDDLLKVDIVKEYDPFEDAIRNVAD